MRRVLRYLSGTKNFGIQHRHGEQFDSKIYSDSDWAGCTTARKSTTGFIVTIKNSPVSCKSLCQLLIALSSAEAEYIALSTATKELTWIIRLCREIQFQQPFSPVPTIPTIPTYCDNTASIAIALQAGLNAKSRHIKVWMHHIRDLLLSNVISLQHIKSEDDIAAIFIKPVDKRTLVRLSEPILESFVSTIDVSRINNELVICLLKLINL